MIKFFILSGFSLLAAILIFGVYNSGTGAPLVSLKKKMLFVVSFISFCLFIFFLKKAYYSSENKKNERE